MGITTDEFFENIYSVIFSPKAFFEKKDIKVSIRLAIGTIIFITLFSKLAQGVFNGSLLMFSFWSSLFFQLIITLFLWFFTALFFEYVAKIFSREDNINKLLFYTAFAPIPYIFFAPLNLIKHYSSFGYFLGSITEFILYFWIITLYAYSIRAVYDISLSRSFMLIFLPFISSLFAIYWMVCFFMKIGYIFSI